MVTFDLLTIWNWPCQALAPWAPFDRWSDWGHEANLENPFAPGEPASRSVSGCSNISSLHPAQTWSSANAQVFVDFPGATWRVVKNMIGFKDQQICLLFWNLTSPGGVASLPISSVHFIDGKYPTHWVVLKIEKQCIQWIFSGSWLHRWMYKRHLIKFHILLSLNKSTASFYKSNWIW